jgi:hypothetical protein
MAKLVMIGVVAVLCGFPIQALAACAVSSLGIVYCARYPTGGAERDNTGTVLCGKGECRRDHRGAVYCSRVEGGGAGVDPQGFVRCLGGCEPGSRTLCEEGQ